MTDKELKKLGRAELVKMLISVSEENESLKAQIAEQMKQLDDRKLTIRNAGSIAEACLQINGVFEAAQAAAEQYLENIRNQESLCDQMRAEAEEAAKKTVEDAQAKAQSVTMEAEETAKQTIADAQARAQTMTTEAEADARAYAEEAEAKANDYWENVSRKLSEFYDEHKGLQEMLKVMDIRK